MKNFNYKLECPFCGSKIVSASCPQDVCYAKYEYVVREEDSYVDFYLGNYIIEYNLNEDGTYKETNIISRNKVQLMMRLNVPFDFSLGVDKISKKIESLQVFK